MSKFFLTEKLPPYIFASIYQLKQQAIESGFNIIDFGMGNPDSAPPQHVMNELAELAKDPKLFGYSVTGGIEILKKAICDYYQRRFNVELDYKQIKQCFMLRQFFQFSVHQMDTFDRLVILTKCTFDRMYTWPNVL